MKHNLSEIHSIRTDYIKAGLNEDLIKSNAMEQFSDWFDEALTAKVIEPNAMTLATADKDGQPDARIVLLKGLDKEGFVFFTNYNSKKGRDISENGLVALSFFWPELERQVRIQGSIEKISHQQSEEYFHSRPIGSQLGAWASPQSSIIESREVLEKNLQKLGEKYDNCAIPLPDYWGGFRINAHKVEFWQGRADRLHDRIVYEKGESSWKIYRIAP